MAPVDAHPVDPAAAARVVELPEADPRWDAYVEAHAERLVFHHSAWLRALEREYGQRALRLAVQDAGGMLRGVLPLMVTRGLPLPGGGAVAGRRLASLPRTPVAGPLADGEAWAAALLRGAVERTPEGAQLQIKPAGELPEGAGLVRLPWRESFVVTLPDPPAAPRFGNSRNHSRIKWAVSKAMREGVAVRDATGLDDVRRWHRLYLDTMRHHVVPPRSRRFFEGLWEELAPRGMVRLLLAERDGDLLAGAVVVTLGATAFYLFNGVRRDSFALRPNDVLQWRAIHDCAEAGIARYDLGEVVEHHAGLAEFKRKWGADAVRLHRWYHPAPAEAPDPGDGAPGRLTSAAHRAWQRVPLGATARAGDLAYRWL